MAVVAPQNAPDIPSDAGPSDSVPLAAPTDFESALPPAAGEVATIRRQGGVGGLILIGIGLAALFATWMPGRSAWLFLGMGSAFLFSRILTGRSGYAVPAGILLGFGAFVLLTEVGYVVGPASGGLFFICLGLGCLASYAIAARPDAVWPILPGLLLVGFGAFVEASTFGAPFADFWWLVQFWPLILVVIGAWLLFRDRLPEQLRTPVVIVGTAVLILVGLLVAASAVATAGIPYTRGPLPRPWPMIQVPFGNPPLQDTIVLSGPVEGVTSIRLVNSNGYTLVRSTAAPQATVQATRHFWNSTPPPDIRLVSLDGVLVVDASAISGSVGLGFTPAASVHIDTASLSGDVYATGLNLTDQSMSAHRLSGDLGTGGPTVSARTTSGSIHLVTGS